MKFTQLQQAYIDKVQASIPNPLPLWLQKVCRIIPPLVLLGLVWGHWFDGPKIVGDFAYALMTLFVILSLVASTIFLGVICVKDRSDVRNKEGIRNTDKLLFGPNSPIFYSTIRNAQSVIFYLGGFLILIAMGHGILGGATLIAGVFVYLYHVVFIKDAKIRLTIIDPEDVNF